jgi:hypothetical protein
MSPFSATVSPLKHQFSQLSVKLNFIPIPTREAALVVALVDRIDCECEKMRVSLTIFSVIMVAIAMMFCGTFNVTLSFLVSKVPHTLTVVV